MALQLAQAPAPAPEPHNCQCFAHAIERAASRSLAHPPARFRIVTELGQRSSADLYLVNSCTVKSPSQSQMATTIQHARARGLPVVVAGCVPQGDKRSRDLVVRCCSCCAHRRRCVCARLSCKLEALRLAECDHMRRQHVARAVDAVLVYRVTEPTASPTSSLRAVVAGLSTSHRLRCTRERSVLTQPGTRLELSST